MQPPVWVMVLAGGIGSRFWPLSTPTRPKQLLPLASSEPLICDTLARVDGFTDARRLRVLCGEPLVGPIKKATGLDAGAFFVEPQAKGTAPVLVRAAWEVAQSDPDATLVSLHSDHLIRPTEAFRDLLSAGVAVATREKLLLTVAVPPDRPETGYGYLKAGEPIPAPSGHRAFRVDAFVEKPDFDTAVNYVRAGYFWNSGIFIWPVATFLEEVTAHTPEIARALPHLERGNVAAFFEEARAISVDEGVMERSDRVASIEAKFQWDDVGSWEALSRTHTPDSEGNVSVGDVYLADSSNNIAVAEDGQLVLLGVKDLVAVRTAEVTMVMPRAHAARLNAYLAEKPDLASR